MALEHDTQVLAKQILEDLKPELVLPSPYSVWDPGKMKFEVAGVTNPQSLAEMQALLVKKAFTVSDMYILRVIRMLGHADLLSICTVLMAEREKEERKAKEENRPIRCIPKLDRRSLKERLDTLAMSGLVIVEKFQINESVYAYLKSAKSEAHQTRQMYSLTAHATYAFRTMLEADQQLRFDSKTIWLNEMTKMERANAGLLAAVFLKQKYMSKYIFSYRLKNVKGIDELPAIIDFKKEGVMPTRLVIFAVNFYTNERIVTEKDHSYYINSKVRGFCTALRAVIHETTGNGSTFAAIICEDAKGIQKVISMIQSIDEPLMKHCIFTTGTVLISRSALSKADVLPGCFVEPVFNSEKARWQIVGATGFYFLEA